MGATRNWPATLTCRAPWGGLPPSTRCLDAGRLSWAQVLAGEAALGAVLKDAKEQLRALPDGLTYGVLRYLNTDVDLAAAEPPIGFNYVGRLGTPATHGDGWRICPEALSATAAAAAVATPLMHTVELDACAVETDVGPQLQAAWTWAPSAVDRAAITGSAGCGLTPWPASARMCGGVGAG